MPTPDANFTLPGQRVRIPRWVFGDRYVVQVEVEAVVPDDDPSEPCLDPATLRYLDQIQQWINAGQVDELEKAGAVYTRQSA
jgi:hypothetical protein